MILDKLSNWFVHLLNSSREIHLQVCVILKGEYYVIFVELIAREKKTLQTGHKILSPRYHKSCRYVRYKLLRITFKVRSTEKPNKISLNVHICCKDFLFYPL